MLGGEAREARGSAGKRGRRSTAVSQNSQRTTEQPYKIQRWSLSVGPHEDPVATRQGERSLGLLHRNLSDLLDGDGLAGPICSPSFRVSVEDAAGSQLHFG